MPFVSNLFNLLPYIEIGLAVLLVVAVLIQRSEAGLGSAFGDYEVGTKITRRGFDKFIFNATIVIAILFVLSLALNFLA